MKNDNRNQVSSKVILSNYHFSGIDNSQIGAIKSVADYYGIPVSTSCIFGMTGLAFLTVVDESLNQTHSVPVPEVYEMAGNIGIQIEGIHVQAEGEKFKEQQAKAWEKARAALDSGCPVFASDLDLYDETSLVYGYDHQGYYTHSWHAGYDYCDDVVPWTKLGYGYCPCINCVNQRAEGKHQPIRSLISLHWAKKNEPKNKLASFKEALKFVIKLNEANSFERGGRMLLVGSPAYRSVINALKDQSLLRRSFGLIMDTFDESKRHAVLFLQDINKNLPHSTDPMIQKVTGMYEEMARLTKSITQNFPFEQPLEPIIDRDLLEKTVSSLTELKELDAAAIGQLKEIYHIIYDERGERHHE